MRTSLAIRRGLLNLQVVIPPNYPPPLLPSPTPRVGSTQRTRTPSPTATAPAPIISTVSSAQSSGQVPNPATSLRRKSQPRRSARFNPLTRPNYKEPDRRSNKGYLKKRNPSALPNCGWCNASEITEATERLPALPVLDLDSHHIYFCDYNHHKNIQHLQSLVGRRERGSNNIHSVPYHESPMVKYSCD
ncbi:hypothetical protein DFS34DRAFT_631734, partial [Phlyctochytrium arcticum]